MNAAMEARQQQQPKVLVHPAYTPCICLPVAHHTPQQSRFVSYWLARSWTIAYALPSVGNTATIICVGL